MSSILYYSKYCEVCKKYLQIISRSNIQNEIHFICIDKRYKGPNDRDYTITLDNGQRMTLPSVITKVPALLLINKGYEVIFGEKILEYLKPRQQQEVRVATMNNMEPMAFSLAGGGFGSVVSDQYSFLDQDPEELKADGNGGMRQMHNYVDLNTAFSGKVSNHGNNDEFNTTIRGAKKMGEDAANQQMEDKMKRMQEERDADLRAITGNRPPMSF